MERVEERPHPVAVLVHERRAAKHAIGDEERLARDMLEDGHGHRQGRSEHRQQLDLELERLFDAGAPREAEHPLVVDDRHLEVVALVDPANRRRAASECVCDQARPVGRHLPIAFIPRGSCQRRRGSVRL